MVHWKHKPLDETTWTPGLLDVFMDTYFKYCATPGKLPLLIKGKSTEIKLSQSGETTRVVTYAGNFPHRDLKSIYYVLAVSGNDIEDQNSLGYLEILNGITNNDDETPMLRGFVKGNFEFFNAVDDLIKDAKSFGSNSQPIIFQVHTKYQDFINANTHDIYSALKRDRIYKSKIGIDKIEVYTSFNFC